MATCYAIAPLVAARYLGDVPALPLTAACLGVAALVYAAPAAATWPDHLPGTRILLALAALALICTATAFIVFFALIREVGAARTMVFTYVNPAVALAAGVIVLSEPLTPWNIAGLALILSGSVLATRRPDADPVPPRPGTGSARAALANCARTTPLGAGDHGRGSPHNVPSGATHRC